MPNNPSSLSCCGLYCGACNFLVAFEENNREHLAGMPARYDDYRNAPMDRCPGCRAEECGHGFTACTESHGVEHCGRCDEFPCARLLAFAGDGMPHHAEVITNLERIRRIGEELWLKEQSKAWRCSCDARLSWYLRTCPHCGRQATPVGLDETP